MIGPKISVIIPHLNQPDHLHRCLQSLASQAFDPAGVEIIVVDNGSRNLPHDICEQFPNVRLESERNPGPGPARNRGVASSFAPILAFIDADCIADPHWLQTIVQSLDGEAQAIGGDVRIAVANCKQLSVLEAYESVYAYRQEEYIEKHGFSGTGNLAMTRSVYQKVGPFGGIDVAEDRDWGSRAKVKGIRIRYCAGMVVFHPARTSFSDIYKKWDRHISHDFNGRRNNLVGGLLWWTRAVAVAGSPLYEVWRVLRSDRITTPRERWMAFSGVLRIRLYRARVMGWIILSGHGRSGAESWNR